MPLDWLKSSKSPVPPAARGAAPPARATRGGDNSGGTEGALPDDPEWTAIVRRWHPSWRAADLRFRWLMDSLVAGERYINGVYGYERDQYLPVRNLIRHQREYPDPQKWNNPWNNSTAGGAPITGLSGAETALGLDGQMSPFGPLPGYLGSDPHSTAHDDDYEYRRSRTVPPNFVGEAVSIHLGKIFDQEIKREGPELLEGWWKDVDGRGTPMDDWFREKVAPLYLVLGCIDIVFDHPRIPEGQKAITRADELRLKLDRCIASYILPQNMVWWRLDTAGRYACCLIREYADPSERYDYDDDGNPVDPDYPEKGPDRKRSDSAQKWKRSYVRWRWWNSHESVLLNHNGDRILERTPHGFGRVPIVRLIHRHDPHADNMGLSEYETIARYMRAYYNLDSELCLSNSLQAHPFLSGSKNFCKADNTISIGPGYVLPMDLTSDGQVIKWEFVSPPKDPAESLRKDKDDIREAVDRDACLAKPAGVRVGTSTVGQSGIAKELDAITGHKKLRGITKSLAKAEREIAEYALMVLTDTPVEAIDEAERQSIKVVYPAKFELRVAAELSADAINFQKVLASAGDAPEAEAGVLKALVRMMLQDLDEAEYETYDAEIDLVMQAKARIKEQYREGIIPGTTDATEVEGKGTSDRGAETDILGQSAQTSVSGFSQLGV